MESTGPAGVLLSAAWAGAAGSSRPLFFAAVALAVYVASVNALMHIKTSNFFKELAVRLPLPVQVLLAGGDRYLAANMLGIRVLVADTFRMSAGEFELQAQLQKDISWLNPAHEDNYYIAAAILSEPQLIPTSQQILRRAADARPRDWTPLFYYGFNRYHFEKNPSAGAQALLEGVPRALDQGDRWALENLAARWIEQGYKSADAATMVENMARNAPEGNFRRYLEIRARRLRDLDVLKQRAADFREKYGRPLQRLEQLVETGMITAIPADPFRQGFSIDANGEPAFYTPTKSAAGIPDTR